MEIEIIHTCPLGSNCEEIKEDKKLYRCRWYQKLIGSNPQTDEPIEEFRCVFEWMNILEIENTKRANETGAAVESLRNGINKSAQSLISGLVSATNQKKLQDNQKPQKVIKP